MAISIRCPFCGNDNLFPADYAGHRLPCAHCGDTLIVPGTGVTPPGTDTPSWGQRIRAAVCRGLGIVFGVLLGGYLGFSVGLWLANQLGILGLILRLVTVPAGVVAGLLLGRSVGRGLGRWIGRQRFACLGLLVGIAGGVLLWTAEGEASLSQLTTLSLSVPEWIRLTALIAMSALALGTAVAVLERTLASR